MLWTIRLNFQKFQSLSLERLNAHMPEESTARIAEDMDEYYPFPFDRSVDPASLDNYANKLRGERDKALENPLAPGCNFSCLIVPPKSPSHTTATRPLPWFAKTESTLSCELQRPLKTGVDIWSQVWVTRVIPPRSVDADVDLSLSLVVMKFIQPSLLRIPDERSVYLADYQIPERVAKCEAFIYGQLEPLQGDVIPYFFGIQTASLVVLCSIGKLKFVLRSSRLPANRRGFWWLSTSMGAHFVTTSRRLANRTGGRRTPRCSMRPADL